jgi:hypothetical protein
MRLSICKLKIPYSKVVRFDLKNLHYLGNLNSAEKHLAEMGRFREFFSGTPTPLELVIRNYTKMRLCNLLLKIPVAKSSLQKYG